MAGTYQATVNVRRAGVMLGSLQSSLTAR
jgi:hypothetical protein